jgi:hypothetical protein
VRDGSFVKIDKTSNLIDSDTDYLIFTQLNGYGLESMGVIKAASKIDIDWVRNLMPKLKDKIDTSRLSGISS